MTWKENLVFMGPLSALAITLAFGLALFGFWPILPLAGIELLAVLYALYWVSRQGEFCERVLGDESQVTIEKGFHAPQSKDQFPSAWARVELIEPKHHWYPNRVLVGSHGKRVELGRFLTDEEREELAALLAEKVGWAHKTS